MPKKAPRYTEVSIEKLSKSGYGIGTYHNPANKEAPDQPIEVPFTLPGDTVEVQIYPKKRGMYQSKLIKIITPSSQRTEPKCIHFGTCGGCRWQHIPYAQQILFKELAVRKSFAKLIDSHVIFHPIVPCDPPWQYRNKMEFSFSDDREKRQYLGLMMNQSQGKVLNLQECHLVNPWMIDVLKAVRQWWSESKLDAYHMPSNRGSLRTLITREGITTGDRLVMLTVSGNPDYALDKQQLESFKAFVKEAAEPVNQEQTLSIFLRIQQVAKGSPTNFYEMHLNGLDHIREELQIQDKMEGEPAHLKFMISPSAFFQPNTRQAQKLYSRAFQMAKIPDGSVVYDLYCGAGALGLCAARRAKQVVGIELSPEASLDARTNAKINHLENVTILTGSVGDVLEQISSHGHFPSPDAVLVDPPRAGLDPDALNQVVKLGAKTVIYISCNPETQAINIEELCSKGYKLKEIQPVDQFPQTVHIENIAILEK